MPATGFCPHPACRRPYVLTADGKIRFHNVGGRRISTECPGSGKPPGSWNPDTEPLTGAAPTREDEIRAAAYREAAQLLAEHPGPIPYRPQLDESGGFWWDTRDRDAAAQLLRDRADQIASTAT